jgi:hypothetical protein
MSAVDLTAVCERHGITVTPYTVGSGDYVARDHAGWVGAQTPADAVCALLKARWGITTRRGPGDGVNVWGAQCDAIFCPHAYPTELAAVAALADRLRATARVGGA